MKTIIEKNQYFLKQPFKGSVIGTTIKIWLLIKIFFTICQDTGKAWKGENTQDNTFGYKLGIRMFEISERSFIIGKSTCIPLFTLMYLSCRGSCRNDLVK